jgi:succinate-acetate transporter protein
MAVVEEDVRAAPALPVADPAPLGLAAFALTTFILSGHNATFIPDLIWVGAALFYGGLVQLLAGMWEFRNRNVFGSTAFSTYGGFWLALGTFVTLFVVSKSFNAAIVTNKADLPNALAWFLLAFAIFNFYMLLWSTRVNMAVFGVFLTLQITEVLLAIGFFMEAHGHANNGWVHAGGWAGIVTAGVAWYTSAAGVVNGMSPRTVLPVGAPFWGALPATARPTSPMPRRVES